VFTYPLVTLEFHYMTDQEIQVLCF